MQSVTHSHLRYLIEEDEYRLTDFIKSGVPRREFEQLVMALHEIGFSEQVNFNT